ncbi:transporter substrate-binding domain-containing protein [Catenuloplanes atrovinosus]|uniref:Glutamate transport system substrate-binding protein n=1 Tax=Catenuloplanes atrovinosus TaxID=137266 RepID=A0AAE4CAS5_9ACTN|nr:transporter substrate-binding domain-containing protein [Catenuloplanes atrovinosus]MDR7277886.1 glutamate transport system substrate-binding protein [Catenuloplanes atrovinosus]
MTETPERAARTRPVLRNLLWWLTPTSLATAGLTVLLLLNRAWGADVAAIAGLPLSVAAIVVSILIVQGWFTTPWLRVPTGRLRRGRLVAALTVVVLLAGAVFWWVRREPDPFEYMSGEVRIGYVDHQYKGWHTDGPGGTPVGFDADLVREIGAHFTGANLVWVDLSTLDNREAALAGRWRAAPGQPWQRPVKLVVSTYSMTPERAERVDFAGPYFVDMQGFVSRTGATSIADIPPGKVCVLRDSNSDKKLTQAGFGPVREDSLAACFSQFKKGHYDAVSHDRSLIAGYAEDRDLKISAPLTYGAEKYAVAMPNNMPRLCEEISKVIDDFLRYSWSESFAANLVPLGLAESDYVRPPGAEPCQPPGPRLL